MSDLLLQTKLTLPPPRPRLVPRPRLLARLLGDGPRPLTLIVAPAGFGKTTLAREWAAQAGPAAWLSLENDDSDPAHLLAYLIAAIQTQRPGVGATALALLGAPQAPALRRIMALLINDLAALTAPLALVLDDYHTVDTAAAHDLLAYLVDHLPPQMRLALTSRSAPPLPLARWRVRDQLAELRADDLRFTPAESASFFNQVMSLDLAPAAVAALAARTEGWAAGLQLAALSLHGAADRAGAVAAFAGTSRLVLDYLVDEVLARQPAEIQHFLLHTAILDRLCAPLCDAVLEIEHAALSMQRAERPSAYSMLNAQFTLEQLERANLFLTPLDHERRWYRYHQLFAEALRVRLQQVHPGLSAVLHARAGAWYAQQGSVGEALQHLVAAGEADQAAELIERGAWALLGRGDVRTVRAWIDALPNPQPRPRPRLHLIEAWACSLMDEVGQIEARLLAAEAGIAQLLAGAPGQIADDERRDMLAQIAALRGYVALSTGNAVRAIELCRSALDLAPAHQARVRSLALMFLGLGHRHAGSPAAALEAYTSAIALAQAEGSPLITLHALANLGLLYETLGRLGEAAQTYQLALRLADGPASRQPAACIARCFLGRLWYEWNSLEQARPWLTETAELAELAGLVEIAIHCRETLALMLQAQGDAAGANATIGLALQSAQKRGRPLSIRVPALAAQLHLLQGNLPAAVAWAQGSGLRADDTPDEASEQAHIGLARVLIAQGSPRQALGLLARLQTQAERAGRMGSAVQILMLAALARQALGAEQQAIDQLGRALALAEPEGYVRTFADAGQPMRALLAHCRADQPQLGEYIDRLLAAMPGAMPASPATPTPLAEPLSERELQVLRLLAAGHSNQAIAETLMISLSTTKTHLRNIYGKLGVASRTQALAQARALGWLE